MLTRSENERLTRVGPGTPMGELMRRYWIPAAFSEQVAQPDGPPIRVRLMGEDLVLFRDTQGRLGLVDEYCPHRTASMYFGRNEDSGLRCVYHGLKFDVTGACVDAPCLPPNYAAQAERIKGEIRIKSYPCIERGGAVWAYMGPKAHEPAFPDLEWTLIPASHRHSTRHVQECNWLQALEGGFDAAHLTFLHAGETDTSRNVVPSYYEVMPTDFGFAIATGRDLGGASIAWNINIMLMPFHKIISTVPPSAHVWAPIDDETTMLYSVEFRNDRPLDAADQARIAEGRGIHTENIPGTDIALRNKANDYLLDRDAQASGRSYSGLKGLAIQDCAIQESMGAIADRTREYLLPGDAAVVKLRRLLLKTLDDHAAGKPLPGMDAASYRVRSSRCEAPKGMDFAPTMVDRLRTGGALAAE
jgi:nitrite reductase/ring-hydroxylating ferredoxin subunit